MSPVVAILCAIALLAMNAVFVTSEFALISSRRTQLEPRAEDGSRAAKLALRAMERVAWVVAGAQLGITLCSLALGAIGESAVRQLLGPVLEGADIPPAIAHAISFVIALTVVALLHVVLGEMVPKNLALVGPDSAALVLGPFMLAVVTVLRPFVVLLNGTANAAVRLMRLEPRDEVASAYTQDQVAALVDESRREGLLDEDEYGLISGALGFSTGAVDQVLFPVDDLVTISRSATVSEFEETCARTGFSRFPVLDRQGQITGYLHIKDILDVEDDARDKAIADKWLRPLATVPAGGNLYDALRVMQARGSHMATVADITGVVVGVVMLEDVLEELVGEVRSVRHS